MIQANSIFMPRTARAGPLSAPTDLAVAEQFRCVFDDVVGRALDVPGDQVAGAIGIPADRGFHQRAMLADLVARARPVHRRDVTITFRPFEQRTPYAEQRRRSGGAD